MLIADDEMEHGVVRVGANEDWFLTMETWLFCQELEVWAEVALFLDALGPGVHRLPPEYVPRA